LCATGRPDATGTLVAPVEVRRQEERDVEPKADSKLRLEALDREERALAARAARGDREAFDLLYDRYFARVAWQVRELPQPEAHAAIWESLEQIFAGLEADDAPLGARAYQIARTSHKNATARIGRVAK
jgi:hypothetical protein